jgi:hypothetical protein
MADSCCAPPPLNLDPHRGNSAYRRILWIVLAINFAMFLVEIGAGLAAGSASLQADALDFFGDAASYAISLMVVGMALRYRASAALAKGATMGLFGLWIIGTVVWHSIHGTLPSALTMGAVGLAALVANAASFGLLWANFLRIARWQGWRKCRCGRDARGAWTLSNSIDLSSLPQLIDMRARTTAPFLQSR